MTVVWLEPHEAWTFSRLPLVLNQLGITERRVLHIGAHLGEELDVYLNCDFKEIVLVEPDPGQAHALRQKVTAMGAESITTVVEAAVTGDHVTPGQTATWFRASRSVWNGLKQHPTDAVVETIEVPIINIDEIMDERFTVLVVDTQGTELDIVKRTDLSTPELLIIETTPNHGDSASNFGEVDNYMGKLGWMLVEKWIHDGSGYHDCLYAPIMKATTA